MPEVAEPIPAILEAPVAPPQPNLITGEELLAMADIGPCELVEGRIIPMPPPGVEHGKIESNIHFEICGFVKRQNLGMVCCGETGIYTRRNPDSVRGADVFFISKGRLEEGSHPGYLEVAPDLVVEILSPSNTMSEMMKKLREYFAIGVRLIWLVDPEPRCVYAYRSLTDIRQFTAEDQLPGDDVLPGFSLPVAQLFT